MNYFCKWDKKSVICDAKFYLMSNCVCKFEIEQFLNFYTSISISFFLSFLIKLHSFNA